MRIGKEHCKIGKQRKRKQGNKGENHDWRPRGKDEAYRANSLVCLQRNSIVGSRGKAVDCYQNGKC